MTPNHEGSVLDSDLRVSFRWSGAACLIPFFMDRGLWPHCRRVFFHLLVLSLVGSRVGICIERDLRLKGRGRGVSGVALDRSIHCSDSRPVSPTGSITDPWVRQCFKSQLCSNCSLFCCWVFVRLATEHFSQDDWNLYVTLPTENSKILPVLFLLTSSCKL